MIRGATALRLGILLAAASIVVPGIASGTPKVVRVVAGDDAQAVLERAPSGSIVVLGEGVHRGPLSVDRSISLLGEEGSAIVAPLAADAALTVTADDVTISDLEVRGGWTGIDLIKAEDALIRRVSVVGADLQGIRVYARSGIVEETSVAHMVDPHAQGIEVLSAPDVVVRDTSIVGGKIGIVAHLSTVSFERNHVTGTTQAGVVIREMSRGTATGNLVEEGTGAGLYCGDMSTCSFRDNTVLSIAPAGSNRSAAGWGLVAHYHSTASTHGDVLDGDAGRAVALAGSRLSADPATQLGSGAGAAWPAMAFSLGFLVLLAAVTLVPFPAVSRRARGRGPVSATLARAIVPVILVFLFIQTFHMLEHVIQLVRVHGQGVPGRGGLAGQVVDNEWAHFAYNAVVLAGMIAIGWFRSRGWRPARTSWGDRLLVGTVILQGYHLVEHSMKLVQHIANGVKVAPGILGNQFDLVYLHFGINAAVYLGFACAVLMYLLPDRSRTLDRVRARSIAHPI